MTLRLLADDQTITHLWERVRSGDDKITFQRFVLVLDFLYLIGSVELRDGLLRRQGRV
jgi:hypothetical protein